jgi:hypothetical protein
MTVWYKAKMIANCSTVKQNRLGKEKQNNALAAWRSLHRIRLRNKKTWVRMPPEHEILVKHSRAVVYKIVCVEKEKKRLWPQFFSSKIIAS